jgi:N-methylhydantoinase B
MLKNDTGHLLTVSFMGQRTQFPALGFHGGRPGKLRRFRINGEIARPKGRYVLKPGDIVTIDEAGGGGFGNPLKRPIGAVEKDVANGFVSAGAALAEYGVQFDAVTGKGVRI